MADMVGHDAAGQPELIKSTDGAAHVNDMSLKPGDNELLSVKETIPGDVGFEFAGVTTAVDINLGAAGAAGDYCGDVTIYNNSGQNITQVSFKDGTTEMVGLRDVTALATGASRTITGPRTKSKYGGWKINITCAGTMANIAGFARGKFS